MDELFIFFAVISTIVGLTIGSFLNVVALRSLWNEEFVKSGSRCPKCRHDLNWYNNIPLLSFIFQGGRCQFCKCKISIQYPIVEALTGALFLLTYLAFGLTLKSLFVVVFISFFIVMVITDIKEQVVFDWHSYPIIPLGLLYNFLHLGNISILESLLGIFAGLIVFEAFGLIGYLFSKSRAFGFGDTIIAMGLGAIFGWQMLLLIFVVSVLFYALLMIPAFFIHLFKNKDYKMCTVLVLTILFALFSIPVSAAVYKYYYSNFYLLIPISGLIWCAIMFLKSMRNKKTQQMFAVPFGPPLLVVGIVSLFLSFDVVLFFQKVISIFVG